MGTAGAAALTACAATAATLAATARGGRRPIVARAHEMAPHERRVLRVLHGDEGGLGGDGLGAHVRVVACASAENDDEHRAKGDTVAKLSGH
jgi:hypothetical protein